MLIIVIMSFSIGSGAGYAILLRWDGPLNASGGRAQFIERAGEYYDIVEGMRGLWSQYAP